MDISFGEPSFNLPKQIRTLELALLRSVWPEESVLNNPFLGTIQ